ncbi:hypothetical protein PRUPE_1G086400 [Prunus persica]|uniref:Serine-threonine/tyrosine-protein kinase catalytic domain-containing protein n=1 Tax=Prunus persica TaxID=3760 RepID=A0A251QUJ1_PRUPE|nr:hypothetical protein PRUPE_1G086400 [Prunus persica]
MPEHGPIPPDSHPKQESELPSDFGLAKLEPMDIVRLNMQSHVYSFGVVLLEIITGRKAIDNSRAAGEHNLVAWIRELCLLLCFNIFVSKIIFRNYQYSVTFLYWTPF